MNTESNFISAAWNYLISKIASPQQQPTLREEPKTYNYRTPTHTFQASSVQKTTKQRLVLVVSALQADFIESLRAKGCINYNDGESLYEITKYLWLGSETKFSPRAANIKQYEVSKRQESEYDIYLVCIKLNQPDEGFKSDINQLDRYDAFRKLADLYVEFELSNRLQMEAYENIEVYSR